MTSAPFLSPLSPQRKLRRVARAGLFGCLVLAGCDHDRAPAVKPLSGAPLPLSASNAELSNGRIGNPASPGTAAYSYAPSLAPRIRRNGANDSGGSISLNFAETDVRDAVSQILGDILHVNYSIDPAVKGHVTFHTASPLTEAQVLPALQIILDQVHATTTQLGAIYRVVPLEAGIAGGLADNSSLGGSAMVPLHYADATNIAKMLQPFLQSGARVTPMLGANSVLVSAEPTTRNTIVELIHSFDADWLSGQSYALLPVEDGNAKDVASTLQSAMHGSGASLTQGIQILPMTHVNAVLVVARSARYVDDARRIFALIERNRRVNARSWHVFYVQNSNVNDIAYTLQQAFTPNNITATPPDSANNSGQQSALGMSGGLMSNSGLGNGNGGGLTGGTTSTLGGNGNSLLTGMGNNGASSLQGGLQGGTQSNSNPANNNPLLGGLDNTANMTGRTNEMRIIANAQHNAVLVYGTASETGNVEQMLRKIDVMPLQVRIDAVIAEVQLNDALRYGTQFFFKSGGINGVLSANSQTITAGTLATAAFSHTLPGFIIGGASGGGAPFAIDALQNVTTVHVLSSPELMVMDNKPARLQVGQLVPVQVGSQSSTIGTSLYNQYNYQPTGVIMEVTPRVNDNGLVTLDIAQEVSSVNPTSSSTINPTFNDRSVTSRVVVQDNQTVGLAGLITESSSRANSGIPWLKDIPILGFLAGDQNNTRDRTELLILITPHVMHDQREAVALMEDLRLAHPNAASVPDELTPMHESGSPDPQRRVRQAVGLGP
ncbi:type II secretion system secretin GspD [Kozakia baliensis]|uniref:Type II secretion system protein GspD n=1 Tax=Kozakia baliensis TaxID=153496 RepID=A0A1D8UYY9_9PROT|nr:type II secretion system secretin GspD [Kozakia baliensis]AOX18844.1 type II secretion system protein GspD [Kozakia baliensis]GEL65537.1 type II secretion system protein GspD [Kozakia baliensis]